MQRFLPSLTFTIVFVHESLEGKENYKDDWRMGRKHQTFIFCVESVLWYFFFGIAIIVEYESLNLRHSDAFMWHQACWKITQSWTKRLFISTRDNCSEQLTYARIVSHPLGTHSFSRHTFSCLLRGFLFPLESFAILSLHTFVRTLEELTRQEAEELDPHEHAVLSNPAKVLACEFYSRTYRYCLSCTEIHPLKGFEAKVKVNRVLMLVDAVIHHVFLFGVILRTIPLLCAISVFDPSTVHGGFKNHEF